MCATGVALACGVIGVLAILVAVLTGHKFDVASPHAVPDPALAELLYDFAALQGAGMPGAAAQAGFVPAPEPANTGTASPPLASQTSAAPERLGRSSTTHACGATRPIARHMRDAAGGSWVV